MRDVALDPVTGDILTASVGGATRMRLTDPTTGESQAQRLTIRLGLWRGEYQPDQRVGMPYDVIFGRKGADLLFGSVMRRAITTCPGIASLLEFGVTFDPVARAATVNPLQVQADTGQILDLSPLIISDAELRLPGGTPSDGVR